MDTYTWYQTLAKPAWSPPASLFGPVWTVLYVLIAISFGYVFVQIYRKKLTGKLGLPFALNILFNLLFTPIQFGLKNNYLALIDIVLVLGTLIWAMLAIYPKRKWVALIQIPYLAWVCFASILQITITYLNR